MEAKLFRRYTQYLYRKFLCFSKNGANCPQNDFRFVDFNRKLANIWKFVVNINKNEAFQDKIIIFLLDAQGQIVTTQNAMGQLDRSQIQNSLTMKQNIPII